MWRQSNEVNKTVILIPTPPIRINWFDKLLQLCFLQFSRDIIQRGTVGLMKYLRLRINDDDLAKLRERGNVSPSNSPISSSPPVPDKFSMKTSQTINMSKKELSSLPEEAVQNGVEAGVIGVDLSHNQLTAFPDNIEPLIGKLFEMNLSHNKLTQVGSMLGLATQLQ